MNTKRVDVAKKKAQLDKQMKLINHETGRPREKDILTVVRSAVRKAWQFAPTKLSLLNKSALHVSDVPKELHPPKLTGNSKWLYKCNICEKYYIQSRVQVDHIIGEHSLKSYEDMVGFTKAILDVSWDDLRILCIECHSIATYSERYGVSMEEAKSLKEVIAITKLPVVKQRKWLTERGVKPASNQEKRTDQIKKLLEK